MFYRHTMGHSAALAMMLALSSCGDEGGGAVAEAPSTPTPTPPSVPPPSPPSETELAALGGTRIGSSVQTLLSCSPSPLVRNSDGLLTGLVSTMPIPRAHENAMWLHYNAANTFAADVNGFGGATFTPEMLLAPSSTAVRFLDSNDNQLEIILAEIFPAESTTLGLLADTNLCFFAGGSAPAEVPASGSRSYRAFAEGLVQRADGTTRRLLGSIGNLEIDFASHAATITMDLQSVTDPVSGPFGNVRGQPSDPLIHMTATLVQQPHSLTPASITSDNGFTGSIAGAFTGNTGVVFNFAMQNADGDVIWGVIAADSSLNAM